MPTSSQATAASMGGGLRAPGPTCLGLRPMPAGQATPSLSPAFPAGPRPLKFRISLPGGFPLYVPLRTVGDGEAG